MGDAEGYRPDGEKEALIARDPIKLYRTRLEDQSVPSTELDAIEQAAKQRISAAFDHARRSPAPAPEDAFTTVFA